MIEVPSEEGATAGARVRAPQAPLARRRRLLASRRLKLGVEPAEVRSYPNLASDGVSTTVNESDLALPRARSARPALGLTVPRRMRWGVIAFAIDLAMLVVSAAISHFVLPPLGVDSAPFGWTIAFVVLVLVLFRLLGLYRDRLRIHILEDLRAVVASTAIAAMIVTSLRVFVGDDMSLGAEILSPWIVATVALAFGRSAQFWYQVRERRRGRHGKPTLIVGAGTIGHLTARRLLEQPEFGLFPVGYLDKEPLDLGDRDSLPVLGASWDLRRVAHEHGIEHVVVTFSTAPHSVLLGIVKRCEELGIGVSLVPRLFEKVTERLTVEHLGGLPLLSVHTSDPKSWKFALKYGLDRVFAAIGLVFAAPVMAVAALAVLVTMGRPILYSQVRVGRDDRSFTMRKFRSMRPPAPRTDDDPSPAEDDADRLTPVGAFLRRTSIDELPQLFNILMGEMSFVGPRPERPEYVHVFRQDVYRYDERHRVKSGITGWAQVHGHGRGTDRFDPTSLADRVEWDNYYIENWSPWFDLKIVLMTVLAVLRFRQG